MFRLCRITHLICFIYKVIEISFDMLHIIILTEWLHKKKKNVTDIKAFLWSIYCSWGGYNMSHISWNLNICLSLLVSDKLSAMLLIFFCCFLCLNNKHLSAGFVFLKIFISNCKLRLEMSKHPQGFSSPGHSNGLCLFNVNTLSVLLITNLNILYGYLTVLSTFKSLGTYLCSRCVTVNVKTFETTPTFFW